MNIQSHHPRFKNLMGKRYGIGVVIDYIGWINKRSLWKLKCDCGNIYEANSKSLNAGHKTSCGCLLYKSQLNNLGRGWALSKINNVTRLPFGLAQRNNLYSNYKRRAIKKGLDFDLTISEFTRLTKQNCFYCGAEPSQKFDRGIKNNGYYVYNGLDRIDNNIGYVTNNVRSCCGRCNAAKNDMHESEFYSLIKRIYNHLDLRATQ